MGPPRLLDASPRLDVRIVLVRGVNASLRLVADGRQLAMAFHLAYEAKGVFNAPGLPRDALG